MNCSLIDFPSFKEKTMNNTNLQKKLGKTLIIEFSSFFSVVQKSINNKNYDLIYNSCHKIKSTLAVIEIPDIQTRVLKVEQMAINNKNTDQIAVLINECKQIYDDVVLELSYYFETFEA